MKKLLLTLLSFMVTFAVNAERVSKKEALQKAQQFMPGRHFVESKSVASARAQTSGKADAFYVFNAENNGGYVIVSGDDRTRPILGYAERGNLEEDQMPDNMKWWLDNLARQIKAIGTSLKPAALTATNLAEIKPLIQTEWGQGAPYNNMCPDENLLDKGDKDYNAEKLCVTGCVATAMAQIMYYWKWPNECPALDSYPLGYYEGNNFIETNRVKGLPATTFKWDKMKTTYAWDETGDIETGDAADAVAELMRYCGQAGPTAYGLRASASNMSANVMASVFNYSKNVRELDRTRYSTAQWEALIYEELKAKRPVPYRGASSDIGGHQFIVDGYRSDGLFHFNWGWDHIGSYSVLSVADPSVEQAVGGKENENAFQYYSQEAFIGMKPAEAGEVLVPVVYARLNEFLARTYSRSSANADFTDVTLDAYAIATYTVDPEKELDMQLGWGLYQDDQFIYYLGSQTKKLYMQRDNYVENNQTVSFGAGLKAGKYQLCQICRFSDNEQWQRCENYGTNILVAEVSATTMTIRKPDLENMSFMVNSLTTSEFPDAGNPMNFIINVTNTGESLEFILNLWIQKLGGVWNNVAHGEFYVDPDKSADIYLGYTPTEAGNYNLKVTDASDEVLFTSTVTIADTEIVVIDNVKYLCTPAYKRAMVIRNEDVEKNISSITIQKIVTASGVDCLVKAIADNAFNGFWNISELDIPEGVESIGYKSFYEMSNLTKVTLPSTIKRIGEDAFFDNYNMQVVVSNIANPCVLYHTEFKAWLHNSQTYLWGVSASPATLYIPINTRSKYDDAGWTIQFTNVEEGESLDGFDGVLKYSYSTGVEEATVIQDDSYKELAEVTIPATANLGGKSYKVTTVGNNAFSKCYNLTSVTLSDGLVSIGNYSFQSTNIKEIDFPKTLKSIGKGAFDDCRQITAVTLPENLEYVGRYAFGNMDNLEKVVLPSTIQFIAHGAFLYNKNLTSVESHIIEPFDISESVFAGSSTWDDTNNDYIYFPSSAVLYVPIGTMSKYATAKGWNMLAVMEEGEVKEGFDGVLKYSYFTGGDEATVIQDDSYKELAEVTIPATATLGSKSYKVTVIGNRAFMECHNLTSVTLPDGLVSIGKYSFQGTDFNEIAFPKTLKSIGEGAFGWCWQITSVTLPDNLESVDRYAFSYMSNLQRVVLPSTIQSIGDGAFFYNQNLTSVESHITEPFDISESVFAGSSTWDDTNFVEIYSPSSAKLYVPAGTKSKYAAAKGWNMFAGTVYALSGDADGNGDVNAVDIDAISKYIMGGNTEGFIFKNADVNGDKKVNAADIVLIVNMIK